MVDDNFISKKRFSMALFYLERLLFIMFEMEC